MRIRAYLWGGAVIVLASFGAANAGTVANGVWTPSGCGEAPKPVSIDLSNGDAFSKSLDASDQYEAKSKTYMDCMFKEATADGQAINTAEKNTQDERSNAIKKNEDDIKTGLEKYAKGKK